MFDEDRLSQERRARLAAERLFELKRSELAEANDKIAAHARHLTDQIIEKREEVEQFRTAAEALKGEVTVVQSHLVEAQSAAILAERRLWESLETIQDGFAIFDSSDVLVVANRAYLSVFEDLDCAQPGASYSELLRVAVEEGLVDTDGRTPDDWRLLMEDRWTADTIEPKTIRLWNNQYIRLMDRRTEAGDTVSLALNITPSIRRERALRAAREKAEGASRAKSAFLANMSHEIRTPMNGVVAMAELLAESPLDEEQLLYVETIKSSGEALLVIINDILDYSKIEAAKLVLRPERFDLERTVHEVLTLVQPAATDKGLELIFDYDMFLPTMFEGDTGRIRQIITNLVGNAVKFTTSGHVLVRVVGVPVDEETRQKIHLTVEDTGIGIAEDMLDHVFGEFNQAESDRSRSFDGTGLGLAITRQLVRLMGGEVWVDSELGKGSSFGFHITLPVVERPEFEGAATPDWIDRGLVLDPNPASRKVLQKQLAALGLTPSGYGDIAALDAAGPGARDLVLIAARGGEGSGQSVRVLRGPLDGDGPGAEGAPLKLPILRRELLDRLTDLPAPEVPAMPDEAAVSETTAADTVVALVREVASVEDAPEVLPEAKEEIEVAPPAAKVQPRQMRVLAAEDNKTNRLVLSKLLKDLDIDLIFAENGAEAVELFKASRPDIFFTDISMPVMDGKAAATAIRAHEAETGAEPAPIVAMTAHAMSGDKEEILAAGIDYYLTKPLKKAALVEYIVIAAPDDVRPPVPADKAPSDGPSPAAIDMLAAALSSA